jgi:hypothetical protein
MTIPVLGDPEEGGVTWVDEAGMEARRLDPESDTTKEPDQNRPRNRHGLTALTVALHFVAVLLRWR